MSSFRTPDFGAVAEIYDEVRPADEQWREVFELLVAVVGVEGMRVLDVGCGTGRLVAALVERGVDASGVDVSPEMLAVARRKLAGQAFSEGQAERLPFADASFDRVVFSLVVHLVDRRAAFGEARRVLAPAGRLAVVTFDRSHFGGYYLQQYFPSLRALDEQRFPDRETLERELAAAGFDRTRFVRLRQEASVDRDSALRRVRARHISTFQLIGEAEYAAGLERLERDLPTTVEYTSSYLLVVSER
jgi:SAM-dependent methyltransferase